MRSPAFLRVWSYLLCVASWKQHLDSMEEAIAGLLGVLEDDELL